MNEQKKIISELETKPGVDKKIVEKIREDSDMFPFSKESHILSYLAACNIISFEEYSKIVENFKKRNKFLYLFDMAPRTFGQTWGEEHILSICPNLKKATRENLKEKWPNFDGEFDLFYEDIRIEVKACRANKNGAGSLSSRAYSHEEAKEAGFKYHMQQLKPSCCDVFIFIGVCKDEILYWVLSNDDVRASQYFGPQHRNENSGENNTDIFEGQLFMTEEQLYKYMSTDISSSILDLKKSRE